MNLLLDTNILIHLAKDPGRKLLTEIINPDSQKVFVSIASIGELKSIGLQNSWGIKK
jgi:tRNA(fMet)-specific endonuclease VapC